MFYNTNPYKLRKKIDCGNTHYYISFMDGQAIYQETEVSRLVYAMFLRFVKVERSLRNWDERHREYSELTDETLCKRALSPPKNLDETVFDSLRNDYLRQAIQKLSKTQRRRLVLYHEYGLTYEQIAKMEGCSHVSISIAVKRAEKKIKESIKKFENQV